MTPPRDPVATRAHILEVTAKEMAEKGFQATSLGDILDKTAVSKGALYHHFPNKLALGYAVLEEVFAKDFLENWHASFTQEEPIDAFAQWVRALGEETTLEELQYGCPVCNIATEMCSVDEGFRDRIFNTFETLEKGLSDTLTRGQQQGVVKHDINTAAVAKFIVAAFQGIAIQGKYARDINVFVATVHCMSDYILSLKIPS